MQCNVQCAMAVAVVCVAVLKHEGLYILAKPIHIVTFQSVAFLCVLGELRELPRVASWCSGLEQLLCPCVVYTVCGVWCVV